MLLCFLMVVFAFKTYEKWRHAPLKSKQEKKWNSQAYLGTASVQYKIYLLVAPMQITSRRAARSYMKIVDNSYIGSSDEVCLICLFFNLMRGIISLLAV